MANLTSALPRRTGDLERDYNNLYSWATSLVDELKAILCNLDSGNVTEAAAVKAQNIDVSQAKIKDAQIKSLTADKLTAGTIDTGEITISNKDSSNSVVLDAKSMVFTDENGVKRIAFGRNADGNYIYTIQNKDATQGIYMQDDGNINVTGVFSTGKDGSPITIIDGNGICGYNTDGKKDGLWCNNPIESATGKMVNFGDFILYHNDTEIFRVKNNVDGSISLSAYGKEFLTTRGDSTAMKGNWQS